MVNATDEQNRIKQVHESTGHPGWHATLYHVSEKSTIQFSYHLFLSVLGGKQRITIKTHKQTTKQSRSNLKSQ